MYICTHIQYIYVGTISPIYNDTVPNKEHQQRVTSLSPPFCNACKTLILPPSSRAQKLKVLCRCRQLVKGLPQYLNSPATLG